MLKNGRSIMPKRKRKSTSKDNDFKKLFDCLEMTIVQCSTCKEAWPLTNVITNYECYKWKKEKKLNKKI